MFTEDSLYKGKLNSTNLLKLLLQPSPDFKSGMWVILKYLSIGFPNIVFSYIKMRWRAFNTYYLNNNESCELIRIFLTKWFYFSVISEIKYLEELTIGNNKLLIAIIAAIVALILLAILTYVLYRVSEITTVPPNIKGFAKLNMTLYILNTWLLAIIN